MEQRERGGGERIFELNEAYIDFSYFLLFFILVAEKHDFVFITTTSTTTITCNTSNKVYTN